MRELVGYRPEYDPLPGLRAVGQVRLARAGEHHTRARGGIRHLVEVLAHVAKGRRHPVQLASAVAVSVPAAREILAQARRWGLVDDQTRLTDAGRDELRAAKIRPRQVVSRLPRAAGAKAADEASRPTSSRRRWRRRGGYRGAISRPF
ncbi:hypothetical protein ACFWCR_04535 [Streptomyces goshikiensis]